MITVLMYRTQTVNKMFWRERPTQSPASDAERFTGAPYRYCSIPHTGQRRCNTTHYSENYCPR